MPDTLHFLDSHAHLTSETLYPNIESLLSRAEQSFVKPIINICTDRQTLERGLEISKKYPWVYNTAATTPHDVDKLGEADFDFFAEHAKAGHLVAIGETGLDYYYEHSPKQVQKDFLVRYLHLAKEYNLPVVIHCREAFEDFFSIIDNEYAGLPGVLHCFTGTVSEAKEVIKRGWYLSLSGIATFKKSYELHEVAKIVPLEQLLIETDSPYLAPQGHRGKVNEPAFVVETAKFIANEKGIALEKLATATYENGKRLFRI